MRLQCLVVLIIDDVIITTDTSVTVIGVIGIVNIIIAVVAICYHHQCKCYAYKHLYMQAGASARVSYLSLAAFLHS